MNDEKVVTNEFPLEGMYGDIIDALDRTRDIVCTAAKVNNEAAKTSLFAGVKTILADCIKAIEDREAVNADPVIEDDD